MSRRAFISCNLLHLFQKELKEKQQESLKMENPDSGHEVSEVMEVMYLLSARPKELLDIISCTMKQIMQLHKNVTSCVFGNLYCCTQID